MQLNSHQIEIVEKIVSGKVYDIPTYLSEFKKGTIVQYSPDEIQEAFNRMEAGKTYLFREEKALYYTDVYDSSGKIVKTMRVPKGLTYQYKECL